MHVEQLVAHAATALATAQVYLITELLTGGELLDAVLEKGHYSEADARLCFHKLLEGLSYLHTKKIAHRDLKLENLLLDRKEDIATVKIADFGLAKRAAESTMETICGTPQYVAPEVILGIPGNKYTFTVDLWSAGVILFILLGGYPPFYDEHEPRLFMKIRRGQYSFDDPVWSKVSGAWRKAGRGCCTVEGLCWQVGPAGRWMTLWPCARNAETAKDLIRKLLTTDPDKRLSAEEALKHEWFKDASVEKNELHGTMANFREQVEKRASQASAGVGGGRGDLAVGDGGGAGGGQAGISRAPCVAPLAAQPARLCGGGRGRGGRAEEAGGVVDAEQEGPGRGRLGMLTKGAMRLRTSTEHHGTSRRHLEAPTPRSFSVAPGVPRSRIWVASETQSHLKDWFHKGDLDGSATY